MASRFELYHLFKMLRTAVNLKNAINQAPNVLDSLGNCYSIEKEWKIDKGLENESESISGDSKIIAIATVSSIPGSVSTQTFFIITSHHNLFLFENYLYHQT